MEKDKLMEVQRGAIPAFIAKLWHMVTDPESDDLICWGHDGTTFLIKDHIKFSSEMLPVYYKHNNMASFMRQLNMYSFHKVLLVDSTSLRNQNQLEFYHPDFARDQLSRLNRIQRKIHSKENTAAGEVKCDPATLNALLEEVKQLRSIQDVFSTKLVVMKKENAALWREHSILRQRHAKQEKIVNKVIQFLVSMVQQSSLNVAGGARRKVPLMIRDRPTKRYTRVIDPKSPPVISEVDSRETVAEEVLPEELLEYSSQDGQTDIGPEQKKYVPIYRVQAPQTSLHGRTVLLGKPVKRKSLIVKKSNKRAKIEEPQQEKSPQYILPDDDHLAELLQDTGIPTLDNIARSAEEGQPQSQSPSQEKPGASSPSEPVSPRLQLAVPWDLTGKGEAHSHLDSVQSDLDLLKDLLKGEGISLDANTVLELFNNNLLDLNMPMGGEMDQEPRTGQELVVAPSLLDLELPSPPPSTPPSTVEYPDLNTPLLQPYDSSPPFPPQ